VLIDSFPETEEGFLCGFHVAYTCPDAGWDSWWIADEPHTVFTQHKPEEWGRHISTGTVGLKPALIASVSRCSPAAQDEGTLLWFHANIGSANVAVVQTNPMGESFLSPTGNLMLSLAFYSLHVCVRIYKGGR